MYLIMDVVDGGDLSDVFQVIAIPKSQGVHLAGSCWRVSVACGGAGFVTP